MSSALRLSVVTTDLPDPPYPADVKANGWKPEVDIQRLKQSRTWVLCPQSYRPWLLMLWIESWESIPAGTYPADDDEMIAARIGMDPDDFAARRKALMRGWVRHSDDLLYHPYITVQVLQMVGGRSKTAERQRRFREANERRAADAVTRDKHDVTRDKAQVTRQSPVSNGQEQEQEQEQKKEGSKDPLSARADAAPACPHEKIIDLYHEVLPELPRIVPSRWPGSADARALATRWREDERHREMAFWRRFFGAVRRNPHWMGTNDRGWMANLRWMVNRSNFDKVIEVMVNGTRGGR